MTSPAELGRIAAAIAIPVDGRGVAIGPTVDVDHRPGEKPGTGTTTYRVAFDVCGRRELVGPTFSKPRPAIDLANLLDLHRPTSRPGATVIPATGSLRVTRKDEEAPGSATSDFGEREPLAPDRGAGMPVDAAAVRVCVVCGGPLPDGSRADRVTDSGACREALHAQRARDAAEIEAPAVHDGADADLTPSRPSEGVGPSSRASGRAVGAPASPRRPDRNRQVGRRASPARGDGAGTTATVRQSTLGFGSR